MREHAQKLVPQGLIDQHSRVRTEKLPLPETGLEGALFELLDLETDAELRQNVKESLLSLVQATSSELLNFWLTMCKDLVAAGISAENLRSTLWMASDGSEMGAGGGGRVLPVSDLNNSIYFEYSK